MTKHEAVELVFDVLTKALDPVILTTATYTEWMSQGYEDYLVDGRQGYVASGWGAAPGEFHERKRLAFLRPLASGVELEPETPREADEEEGEN